MARADKKALIEIAHPRLRRRGGIDSRTIGVGGRLLLGSLLRLMPRVFLIDLVQHALIVLGVLEIAFRQNPVSRRGSVLGKSEIFFIDLDGVAPDAHLRPVAVEGLHTRIDAAALARVVVMVVPAAVMMALTVIAPAAAETPSVLIVSHALASL